MFSVALCCSFRFPHPPLSCLQQESSGDWACKKNCQFFFFFFQNSSDDDDDDGDDETFGDLWSVGCAIETCVVVKEFEKDNHGTAHAKEVNKESEKQAFETQFGLAVKNLRNALGSVICQLPK